MATVRELIDARLLCEGATAPESEEQLREAWQLLIDTGEVWELESWFGRTAKSLIEREVCHE